MSLLPQRKKSAEEIEALRETFGIVAGMPPPGEAAPSAEAPVAAAVPERKWAEPPVWVSDIPLNPSKEQVLPVPALTTLPLVADPAEELPSEPVRPKMVRSLRKSEQGPLAPRSIPAASSKLPVKRQDAQQVDEIRRREALAQLELPPHPVTLVAPLALVIAGYLSVISAVAYAAFYDTSRSHFMIPAALVILALGVCVFMFLKKPLSRHHASFIGMLVLFAIVFGTLSYFPNLQHGT
jgi:hypothetical protein